MPEGAESPPPERQTEAQLGTTQSGGPGKDSAKDKDKTMDKEIQGLQSNPKGPMEGGLDSKFSKKEGNCQSTPNTVYKKVTNNPH